MVIASDFQISKDQRSRIGNGISSYRSDALAADAELGGLIHGGSSHQAYAANSLITSNIIDDGDYAVLVQTPGDSYEALLADASARILYLGHGMTSVTVKSDIVLPDDIDLALGSGSDALMRLSTANTGGGGTFAAEDLVVALDDASQSLHITDKAAVATNWALDNTTHPNVYLHSNTTPATDYLRLGGHDGTLADIDVVGGTTLRLMIAGASKAQFTATALAFQQGTSITTSADDLTLDPTGIVVVTPAVSIDSTVEATSTITGSLHTDGGVGIALDLILGATSTIFLGDTANTFMTAGITLNQAATDNEIFALKSSDVDHNFTDNAETDTYFAIQKIAAADGGVRMLGLTDAERAYQFISASMTETTTKSTAATAAIEFATTLISSNTFGDHGADANLMTIRNNGTTRFIFDAEGSGHADVEWVAYAEHDDHQLIVDMETELMSMEDEAKTGRRHQLEDMKIIGKDSWHIEDGRPRAMVNFTELAKLHHGGIMQMGEDLMSVVMAMNPSQRKQLTPRLQNRLALMGAN